MELNKETIEELRKDPMMHTLAKILGFDFNELADSTIKELEHQKAIDRRAREIVENEKESLFSDLKAELEELEKEGKIKSFEKDGEKYYYATSEQEEEPEQKEEKSRQFIMSKDQLQKFIEQYRDLQEHLRKLEYWYGVKFEQSGSGYNFVQSVNDIIWSLVGIIFGSDNRDDIADFIFGNSNFDSVNELYDELT